MKTLSSLRNGLADAVRSEAFRMGTPAYAIADAAPSTPESVIRTYRDTGRLVVYAGGSETSIFDTETNYLFRAWHDWAHVRSGIGFSVQDECAIARFQLAEIQSEAFAKLVWIEVAEQALEYGRTGVFIGDQTAFTLGRLNNA